jgi:aromatic ring-opening dioxygenase catalytic subunit (LigB family)
MGKIVAAMATVHAPQLFIRPADEDPAQLNASIAAMRELGTMLDETKPDVIVFLGSDHLETFSTYCVPTFGIVAGNRAIAEFAGRKFNLPIHREMAEYFLNGLIRAEFDVAYSEDAILGHTFAVPFEFVLGNRDIPLVPFFTNVYMPPLPNPRRCAALGRAIANLIESRPERVAIIASGGMSHYPGTWKYPQPEFEFDRWMISEIEKGNTDGLLDMTVEQLDEVGNTELLTWATLFGAIGRQPGELLCYTPTWHHGHAVLRFLPARARARPADSAALAKYGGFEFKNKGFEFYKHPPASAYNLNRLLFQVRNDAHMRLRLLDDLDGVATEFGLNALEKEGARVIPMAGTVQKVSDLAEPLVRAGAHPLQALMSLHAVAGEYRKLLQAAAKTDKER